MTGKNIDRLVAAGVFVYALIVYLLTVAPTASFWDAGEFIAIASGLQVSHPPGAPFYMLLGRFFSMFAPLLAPFTMDGAEVAVAVNLVSVFASAFTVLLTHLVIVRLIRIWKGTPETWSGPDRLAALSGGVVGACAFAVTDSFWFNAVEAEVYALSMFFTAIVVWLILRWREEKIEEEVTLRARGEHTFGLRSDRYLVLIAYLFGLAIGVHLLNVLTLFFIALVVYFVEFDRADRSWQQRALGIVAAGVAAAVAFVVIYPGIIQWLPSMAEASGAPLLFLVAVVAVVAAAVWWTNKRRMPVANLVMLSVAAVLIGYSTYGVIFIRSAANPPIDENDPETAEAIVSYLKREQYGSTPLFKGMSYDNNTGRVSKEKLFPRRYSPGHTGVYQQYDSDLEFFWEYQLGHMYWRYFGWNFIGRQSDIQDAGVATGFVEPASYPRDQSERKSRNVYFALPFLLGLFGLGVHGVRDWRRALAVGVLFLVTGVGIIVYLNQYPGQPRERDYSYVASFFAYSLWIGIGVTGLVELAAGALGEKRRQAVLVGAAVAALAFLAVPGVLLAQNFDDHDRGGNYVAPDFARNMLESTAPNAILFTNGDNDTFPLWYLQEVEGVRRDVRVVNLSLLQTPWYIRQLKNQWSRDSAPIPMTLSNADIDNMQVVAWEPREVALPVGDVSPETREAWGNPAQLPQQMTWRVEGRRYSPEFNVLYSNDQVILSILAAVAQDGWQRPVYFASTSAPSGQVGLDEHFQNEGLARRVTPIQSPGRDDRYVPEIITQRLGRYRFTGLQDSTVYLDENARGMVDNYRSAVFSPAAAELARQGYPAQARALMDTLEQALPAATVAPDFVSYYSMAQAYEAMGDRDRVVELMQEAEGLALDAYRTATTATASQRASRFIEVVQGFYLRNRAFDAWAAFTDRLATAVGNDSLRFSADELRRVYDRSAQAQEAAPQG